MSSVPLLDDLMQDPILGPRVYGDTALAPTSLLGEWRAISDELDFMHDSWAQVGVDGSFRVGIFPARAEARMLKAIHLPKIGEVVSQGRPLVSLKLADGTVQVFSAPVSGEVVEVNEALKIDANPVWHDPCHAGWIARISPCRPMHDLWNCSPRRVVLLATDAVMPRVEQRWLAYYGCHVHTTGSLQDAIAALHDLPGAVLAIDAGSFGAQGPVMVERLREAMPELRVIAITRPDSRWQRVYAAHQIACGAIDPVFDYDLADVLHAAFRQPDVAQA